MTLKHHWDRIYRETEEHRLGWYENNPSRTMDLLDQLPGWQQTTILVTGAGTSVLVDELAGAGCRLVLNDLSSEALQRLRNRLPGLSETAVWVCQDISDPLEDDVPAVDIWIDRAVLHFLIDESDIETYFENVASKLRVGGHALFAEFPPHGSPKCAGLELHRYSVEELSQRLGPDFECVDHFDHIYINPAGDPRPYIFALFRRKK